MNTFKVQHSSCIRIVKAILLIIIAIVALLPSRTTLAEVNERSGKQLVDAFCASCHTKGTDGAPIIGDTKAWSKRASQSLTTLSQHAIKGIRKMPAHGGNPGISDFEIKQAITYMVNQSGGSWATPMDKEAPLAERSDEFIVRTQCAKCHTNGTDGAPIIGDKEAWIPRLARGLDATVRSAIHGHGGMPPRGGMADLTDKELWSAVLYMYNPHTGSKPVNTSTLVVPDAADDFHQVISGIGIYLGVVPASQVSERERSMHGGIPGGTHQYHMNITLVDNNTKEQITDAQVELSVDDPVTGTKTKKLDAMYINNTVSYGNYFKMKGWNSYALHVRIKRPGAQKSIVADFKFPQRSDD